MSAATPAAPRGPETIGWALAVQTADFAALIVVPAPLPSSSAGLQRSEQNILLTTYLFCIFY